MENIRVMLNAVNIQPDGLLQLTSMARADPFGGQVLPSLLITVAAA